MGLVFAREIVRAAELSAFLVTVLAGLGPCRRGLLKKSQSNENANRNTLSFIRRGSPPWLPKRVFQHSRRRGL